MGNRDEMARAEKARYQREWRARNREKVREINKRYWMRRAEKAAAERKEAKDGND